MRVFNNKDQGEEGGDLLDLLLSVMNDWRDH